MSSRCVLALLSIIFFAVISSARADSLTIDQANTGLPLGTIFQNVGVFSPIGESFTPSLTSLNFVSLLTEEASGAPYTLEANIRSSSISGAVLETSDPIVISPPSPTTPVTALFIFSNPVPLVPGNLYVIQVVDLSGQGLIGSSGINNYAGGTQILGGILQPDNDLWFREGIISTPEPETLLFLGIGLISLKALTLCGRKH
jgi:hypothetical protein